VKQLGISAVLLAAASIVAQEQTSIRLDERSKRFVVMIRGKLSDIDSIGGGIPVGEGPDRLYIVTANHVVRQGSETIENPRIEFRWLPGESFPATLLTSRDDFLDIAVLSVADLSRINTGFARVLVAGDPVKRGDTVYVLGHPNGDPWNLRVTPDRVAQISGASILFETGLLAPGNSGGALLNDRKLLIGIVRRDQPPNGEAISITRVIEKLQEWNYPVNLLRFPPAPSGPSNSQESKGPMSEQRLSPPRLLSPEPGAILPFSNELSVTFAWEAVSGAAEYRLEIQRQHHGARPGGESWTNMPRGPVSVPRTFYRTVVDLIRQEPARWRVTAIGRSGEGLPSEWREFAFE
jgi:hypothetical protein